MKIEKYKVMDNDKEALAYYLLMVEATQDGTKTIEERDGWYELVEVTSAPVEPIPIEEQYSLLVVQYIRERYSADDETAILRKKLAGMDSNEFYEYHAFCEQCKAKARQELGV